MRHFVGSGFSTFGFQIDREWITETVIIQAPRTRLTPVKGVLRRFVHRDLPISTP